MTSLFRANIRHTLCFGFSAAFTIAVLADCANAQSGGYRQTNLDSSTLHTATHTERSLVQPWGVAISPGQGFGIVNKDLGTFTTYDASGNELSLARVAGPPQFEANPVPSGIVANPTGSFILGGIGALPSPFLFATKDGTISGEYADREGNFLETTLLAIDHSNQDADYTGLAILTPNCCAPFLAVANFKDGFIETYTSFFDPLGIPGAFVDKALPAGYAPYNLQVVGGQVFVTYALQDAARNAVVVGPGNGIVDIYELDGSFVKRFISHGELNAPWGIAKASAEFGAFSNDILIANFGDGAINAFNPRTGAFAGQIKTEERSPIVNPGLRGIVFGKEGIGDPNTLYFTAGAFGKPSLFGAITATTQQHEE
jgi:uncharacterized protein (TIGR03118 family)